MTTARIFKPLAVDLFCGLFGWGAAFASEGWMVVGFDLEDMHANFGHERPAGCHLVIQDVLTLHGSQFKDAALIVASPPCQAYSYRAMPWSRAKALPPPDNTLFEACFRIQREACEAAGRHIPLIVENVRGAQKWVGRARWNFGSYYLWGDVPALMPPTLRARKFNPDGTNHGQGSWFAIADSKKRGVRDGKKVGHDWFGGYGGGFRWDCSPMRRNSSKSSARKAASAMIARIPAPLALHIARVFKPQRGE